MTPFQEAIPAPDPVLPETVPQPVESPVQVGKPAFLLPAEEPCLSPFLRFQAAEADPQQAHGPPARLGPLQKFHGGPMNLGRPVHPGPKGGASGDRLEIGVLHLQGDAPALQTLAPQASSDALRQLQQLQTDLVPVSQIGLEGLLVAHRLQASSRLHGPVVLPLGEVEKLLSGPAEQADEPVAARRAQIRHRTQTRTVQLSGRDPPHPPDSRNRKRQKEGIDIPRVTSSSPSGLPSSEASFARNLFGATPALTDEPRGGAHLLLDPAGDFRGRPEEPLASGHVQKGLVMERASIRSV